MNEQKIPANYKLHRDFFDCAKAIVNQTPKNSKERWLAINALKQFAHNENLSDEELQITAKLSEFLDAQSVTEEFANELGQQVYLLAEIEEMRRLLDIAYGRPVAPVFTDSIHYPTLLPPSKFNLRGFLNEVINHRNKGYLSLEAKNFFPIKEDFCELAELALRQYSLESIDFLELRLEFLGSSELEQKANNASKMMRMILELFPKTRRFKLKLESSFDENLLNEDFFTDEFIEILSHFESELEISKHCTSDSEINWEKLGLLFEKCSISTFDLSSFHMRRLEQTQSLAKKIKESGISNLTLDLNRFPDEVAVHNFLEACGQKIKVLKFVTHRNYRVNYSILSPQNFEAICNIFSHATDLKKVSMLKVDIDSLDDDRFGILCSALEGSSIYDFEMDDQVWEALKEQLFGENSTRFGVLNSILDFNSPLSVKSARAFLNAYRNLKIEYRDVHDEEGNVFGQSFFVTTIDSNSRIIDVSESVASLLESCSGAF